MNAESLELTRKTGRATYWSRSRQELWVKGETSGHFQEVRDLFRDCDGDTILLVVNQKTAACHTGHWSCFYRGWRDGWTEIADKVFDEEAVYSDKK
jgi:phosphoribosyl-AMP cyclohydrolase